MTRSLISAHWKDSNSLTFANILKNSWIQFIDKFCMLNKLACTYVWIIGPSFFIVLPFYFFFLFYITNNIMTPIVSHPASAAFPRISSSCVVPPHSLQPCVFHRCVLAPTIGLSWYFSLDLKILIKSAHPCPGVYFVSCTLCLLPVFCFCNIYSLSCF